MLIFDRIPARLNVWLMLFSSLFFLYMLRSNFSINMLAMIQSTTLDANGSLIEQPDFGPRYNWSSYDQSVIIGAYFYGYAITSIPVGILTDKFSFAKANVGYSFVMSVLLTVAAPWAASSLPLTVTLRFLMGFVTGGVVPAVNKLISQWSPPNEKGKFVSTLFGTDIGTVITWSMCGVLIESFGWKSAFYGPGILAALFTLLWFCIVYDSPALHPRILKTERDYIEKSLTGINKELKSWPPFKQMLSSVPFWALLFLHYGHIWGMYFLLTAAPKFMNEVLGFNLSSAGFLASLPYLVRLFTGPLFGVLGDSIKSRQLLSTTMVRKGFTVFSHVIPGICLLIIPYVGSNPFACVACITMSFAFNGAVSLTNYNNVHDLSPNYAGTIYAVINAVATSAGFLSPLVVAYFTEDGNSINEWSKIFMVGASVYIVPSILFVLFGSTQIQPWNDPGQPSTFGTDERTPDKCTVLAPWPRSALMTGIIPIWLAMVWCGMYTWHKFTWTDAVNPCCHKPTIQKKKL